jgi:hypothetical protein
MTKPLKNFAASARARLLDLAHAQKIDFQLILQRYVAERFLYRLGISRYRDMFVLKGAMLFVLWDAKALRPTRDLDLAGYWANDAESLEAAFRETCRLPCTRDGLEFAEETLHVMPIRDASEYYGFRITLDVRLSGAVIPFQVDVGFGDVVVPGPVDVMYPVLLDAEPPRIRAYPREAVIAEKLHAMVVLADAISRFKDFFDVETLSARFLFSGRTLTAAISATFSRRKAATFSPWPVALTAGFYTDEVRSARWRRYLQRSNIASSGEDFVPVGERILVFLEAPVRAVLSSEDFDPTWPPGGPWR